MKHFLTISILVCLYVTIIPSDGSPDVTFGTNGIVRTGAGELGEQPFQPTAYAVAIQADGKIVATGQNPPDDLIISRYLTDGTPDPAFSGGVVTSSLGEGRAIALQPDGKIVIAETAFNPDTFVTLRYLNDGTLDNSFGAGGSVNEGPGTARG